MHAPPLAFDLTRLIARLGHASPSGIDRVDLAYARHLLAGANERFGLVWTAVGPRVLARDEARGLVETIAAAWVEDIEAEADPIYRGLMARLGSPVPEGLSAAPPVGHRARGRRRLQARLGLRALQGRGIASLPRGCLYVNTSHMGLERPERFDWLYDRRDVPAVFFVHDLIPISHPEYGRAGEAQRHATRMATVSRHAAHVLVSSTEVGAQFGAYQRSHGFPVCPITLAPLGVEPAFSERRRAPSTSKRPTFLICGTVEARKNHLLLLQIWRGLAERLGPATPRLVIVGRRGWEAENVIDLLERCESLRPHVVEVSGLSTGGLARLMRDATALLMPSFIEGYGLPVVEAAASGLPVVASDIPVHREVGHGYAQFLDPLDGPGWTAAVEALSEAGPRLRSELAACLDGYTPPGWPAHFEVVDAVLDRLSAGPSAP